ncbi:MAG TPA: N-acetylmuramoyl-L-alanine amidase [Bryobacteraceae bacterium]|jgi:N-acetylmuramoyl-L-alanine amidase|nr:N-acetylmuramoyl-L-alanine amidase [Bryobacteraceae bacterium]
MRPPTLIPILLLTGAATLCHAQHMAQLEVTAVRFWTLTEVTRIAIETNGEFRFRSDRLTNPDRLFFDLLGTKPRMGVRGVQTKPVGDKLLKRIRIAETQPGMTRVVLDLESPVDFTASQLSNPDRLMIELRPVLGAPRPVSSARPTPESPAEPTTAQLQTPQPSAPPAPLLEKPEPLAAASVAAKPIMTEKLALPPPPPALAAKRNSTGDRTMIRALGLKVGRVVIDPGHGGHDQGSTGPGGLLEKELVLDVAQRLGKLIETGLGSEVIFTRSDDTFIPLESRTELANKMKADLFLSIHANSSPYPSVSGVETYHLNLTSSREALDLASRENAGSQRSIHDLSEIIQKITQRDKSEESKEFANKMQAALFSAASRSNPTVKNRGVKRAPFVVLIGATMPSILAEIGFLSNTREEALLKRADHRQKLAEALYRGLSRYAETLSHFQVASKD